MYGSPIYVQHPAPLTVTVFVAGAGLWLKAGSFACPTCNRTHRPSDGESALNFALRDLLERQEQSEQCAISPDHLTFYSKAGSITGGKVQRGTLNVNDRVIQVPWTLSALEYIACACMRLRVRKALLLNVSVCHCKCLPT